LHFPVNHVAAPEPIRSAQAWVADSWGFAVDFYSSGSGHGGIVAVGGVEMRVRISTAAYQPSAVTYAPIPLLGFVINHGCLSLFE
jgi:hypothetical protein